MRVLSGAEVAAALDDLSLIDAIDDAFRSDAVVPVRHHHEIPEAGGTLLLMPAWNRSFIGVKTATVFPGNRDRDLASVLASYLLLDGTTGAPLALIDGRELTLRRTAAASALASRYLSRADSGTLLMVGTGALAPHLIRAHCRVRPIRDVLVWGRTPEKARALAAGIDLPGVTARAMPDLAKAAMDADVISCATMAREPLIRGAWLTPGVHIDLVGGFTPEMREADDKALQVARVFVDTRVGAMQEAGDIVDPIGRGAISEAAVLGDLFDLARGHRRGREKTSDITLFKSVGTALEDLAGAALAFSRTEGV